MPRERREQKRKPWAKRRKQTPNRQKVTSDLRCPTGKPGYPSEEVAQMALREIREGPDRRRAGAKPERSFPCDVCGLFHLTSRTHHRGEFVGRYEDAS